MLTREFVCEEHEDHGENGWKPVWMPNADPLWGMAIPHDMLEHPAKCIGNPFEDELMAHGAIYWLRGETYWFSRTGNVVPIHEHLAAEFPDIWFRVRCDEEPAPGEVPACHFPYPEALAVFNRTADSVNEQMRERYAHDPERPVVMSAYERQNFIGWLCLGYLYARKRYRRCDQYMLSELFSEIAKDADRTLKHAELGYRYRVSISLKRSTFTSKLTPWEDE